MMMRFLRQFRLWEGESLQWVDWTGGEGRSTVAQFSSSYLSRNCPLLPPSSRENEEGMRLESGERLQRHSHYQIHLGSWFVTRRNDSFLCLSLSVPVSTRRGLLRMTSTQARWILFKQKSRILISWKAHTQSYWFYHFSSSISWSDSSLSSMSACRQCGSTFSTSLRF